MNQTAVEWLDRWFRDNPEATHQEGNKALHQAKEMEKQQIIDAQSFAISNADMSNNRGYFDCEKYYYGTYGGNHIVDTNEMIDHIGDANKMVEISDEDIEDVAWEKFITDSGRFGFISGAKWYREQLKKKL